MKIRFPAVFRQEKNSAVYSVFFPDILGCVTCGNNFDEALSMAKDALICAVEENFFDCETTVPTPITQLQKYYPNDIVRLIIVEINAEQIRPKVERKVYSFPVVIKKDEKDSDVFGFFPDIEDSSFYSDSLVKAVCVAHAILAKKLKIKRIRNTIPSKKSEIEKLYPSDIVKDIELEERIFKVK